MNLSDELRPTNISPKDFLSAFFKSSDTVCLRVFSDRKGAAFSEQKLETTPDTVMSLTETLNKHNAQNRGIFFVVNGGGHKDSDITRINAQFVESDTVTFDEQWERIQAFPLPPSIVVQTKKSLHCYWLMSNADVSKFRYVQKQLVTQFDGDATCVNESRVLRLPGFNHCKGDPVMVECVKFDPDLRYTQEELSAALPEIAVDSSTVAAASKTQGTRKGLTTVGKRCDFVQYCKTNAAALCEHDWYAMISNLAVFDGGDKAIHALSKAYPNYSYSETQSKIAHFLESGTKPMTCAKIAECGFQCPKLESGGCDCKSPAALAFKPLSTDEILIVLNNFEIPSSTVEKIQKIKEFIDTAIYNIEPYIAETIISDNVKAKFALKTSDIRAAITLYRDAYKHYSESKEARQAKNNGAIPDWYEVTDKGGLRFIPGLLADHMAKEVSAFYGAGAYYFYQNGVYVMQNDISAQTKARSFMLPRVTTLNSINDTVGQWRSLIYRTEDDINPNPYIVNVKNGLINIIDDTFTEHTPEYCSTMQINATYDKTAVCPQFLAFLENILPDSEIPMIQEMLGYLLIPVNKAQKSFVFVGAANAGKSTLLSIAQDILLGKSNVSNIPWQSLGDRFNKAELFGKLANIFADLPNKVIDDGGIFKNLTGEDYISGERKNQAIFNFRPYARLLFSCNDIPKNYVDRSDGFYRRLLIIRFDKSVPMSRRDPNLVEKIAAERDGILLWALDGLRRLIANNYIFSETERTRNELKRYKIESNSALMFLEENCEVKEGAECAREELFERYREYCTKNGLTAMSQIKFNKEVEGSDSTIQRAADKLGKRRTWRGLKLGG